MIEDKADKEMIVTGCEVRAMWRVAKKHPIKKNPLTPGLLQLCGAECHNAKVTHIPFSLLFMNSQVSLQLTVYHCTLFHSP